jgi:hypothetical protein
VSRELYELLLQRRSELAASVAERLRAPDAPHYSQLDPGRLQERATQLVHVLLESVADLPATFVHYIQGTADERIGEGYFLDEIQLALSALEARAWQIVVQESRCEDHARHLAQVSTIVGAAKDHLARVYLCHKRRAEARVARLEQRLLELSRGTDAAPETDEELSAGH